MSAKHGEFHSESKHLSSVSVNGRSDFRFSGGAGRRWTAALGAPVTNGCRRTLEY